MPPADCSCTLEIFSGYGPWLTAGAILLSAIIGACVAVASIKEQRQIAKKRATLDLLSTKEWDEDYIKARKEYVKQRDSEKGLEFWADSQHKDSIQVTSINSILNDYELIAVGIKEEILDEELYRRWFKSQLLKDWRLSEKFIRKVQKTEGSQTIYCEFEWLAVRWGGEAQYELPLSGPPKSPFENAPRSS